MHSVTFDSVFCLIFFVVSIFIMVELTSRCFELMAAIYSACILQWFGTQ